MTRPLALIALLLTLIASAPAQAQEPGFRCSWEDIQVREGFVLPATGVELIRPWITVRFTEGTFYGLEACGALVGVVWAGTGDFQLDDPGSESARLLHERLATLPGRVDLEVALVVAGDGATQELVAAAGQWQEGTVPVPVRAVVQARIAAFDPADGKSSRPPGGLLYAPDPALGGVFLDLRSSELRRAPAEIMAGKLPIKWISYTWSWFEGLQTRKFGEVAVRGVGKDYQEVFASLPYPIDGPRSGRVG